MEILIGIIIGVIVMVVVFLILKNVLMKNTLNQEEIVQTLETRMQMALPEMIRSSNEILINMADQKLGSQKNEIRADMENKRSEIFRLVQVIQQELKSTQDKINKSEQERVGSFMALKSSLDEYKKITENLAVNTEALKKVLSNNQLRGQFGEQIASDLLKMCGFVDGVDYLFNKVQSGTDTRPDFTVLLPDGTRINVDAKFPFANLQKMSETENEQQKLEYEKAFTRDVKEKIKQVTSRDYINPQDRTVDFVILFIPNEMIFSYIYEKMGDIWLEAMSKKVVLAGPFSFTAILRMVRQAYQNFKYQDNLRDIIQNVGAFEKEFQKFFDEFEKIGQKLEAADKQYQLVRTTRMNQLVRRMNTVRLDESSIEEKPKEIAESTSLFMPFEEKDPGSDQ